MADELIGAALVNYQTNTLTKKAPYFTTLSTLYDANDLILRDHKVDKTVLPEESKRILYKQEIYQVWESLLTKIELYLAALTDKSEAGNERRIEIREDFLLGKPIAQYSLVGAYLRLRYATMDNGTKLSPDDICKNLNLIDWRVTAPVWQRVLMNGERVATGKQAALLGTDIIAYLAGEPLSNDALDSLTNRYVMLFPVEEQVGKELPPRFVKV